MQAVTILHMTGLANWFCLLLGTGILFVVWGWVPLERLDKYWSWNNPVGRPLLNTLALTGAPAACAKAMDTPYPAILVPITFFITQYAVLGGRFLEKEMFIAGWVMVLTTLFIWLWFFLS